MKMLKVEAEGVTTSFRYPHFKQSIHPTFEMPPPATIYGHICSALGKCVDPEGLCFAYKFTYAGKVVDLEHIIVAERGSGQVPDTDYPEALRGTVTPFSRHLLFRPRLTLYLNRPEWIGEFRSPRYAVVLGRSQDLFCYRSVSVVEIERASRACFAHTLLPYTMAPQVRRGYTVLMPRFLDYHNRRYPTFARYVVLHEPIDTGDSRNYMRFDATEPSFWVDPQSHPKDDLPLGLALHTFVGDGDEAISLA